MNILLLETGRIVQRYYSTPFSSYLTINLVAYLAPLGEGYTKTKRCNCFYIAGMISNMLRLVPLMFILIASHFDVRI